MDEAGRGPAIGPIVFGLVGITQQQEMSLAKAGIDDSKRLTPEQRGEMEAVIHQHSSFYKTHVIHAHEIDEMREQLTMNQIEVKGFSDLLRPFAERCSLLQIDAADVNAERFGNHFAGLVSGKIISQHKADENFIAVAAASILAKQQRDRIIKSLQKKIQATDPELPLFGSGYPLQAQPFLKAYVKKHKHLPEIARKSWKTCSNILEDFLANQSSLGDYF